MTFTVRTRGVGSWLLCEYRCPEHGVFEATVQRDENGDAPDAHPCMVIDELGVVADLDDYPDLTLCCAISPWTVSAPHPKVATIIPTAAVRGGDMTDRPPGMLDQRDLADGKVTLEQWKAKQRDISRTNRHKALLERGVLQRKIQVG